MDRESLLFNESYQRTFKRGPKRTTVDNKNRKIFYVFDFLVGFIGIILLFLALIISFKGGWSGSGFHDVSNEAITALFMLAVFAIFTSIIGGFGAYTYWKTLIVTYSILTLMCLAFHVYVISLFSSASSNSQLYMARSWWDKITEDVKKSIQDNNQCCGYLDITDFPVISEVCTVEMIENYAPQFLDKVKDEDIKTPNQVIKHDSYYKVNEIVLKNKEKTDPGNVTTVQNNNAQANAGGNSQTNAGGEDQAKAEAGEDWDADLKKRQDAVSDTAAADAGASGDGGANPPPPPPPPPAGDANNGGAVESQPSLEGVPKGCKEYMAPLVKSKLGTVHMVLIGMALFYVLGSGMGWFYWKTLRGFKEFDEFA